MKNEDFVYMVFEGFLGVYKIS
jgi:hypothetical protein